MSYLDTNLSGTIKIFSFYICHQEVVNQASSRRPKSDIFKTSKIGRLQDVVNQTSSKRRKSDVLKTAYIRRL